MPTPNRNRRRGLTQGGTFMLVLSRKIGERILVPHCELAVTVIAVEGNAVRLGISAPEDIAVYREEVWQQLRQEAHGPQSQKSEVRGQTSDFLTSDF
jgi:carbon storage regulator